MKRKSLISIIVTISLGFILMIGVVVPIKGTGDVCNITETTDPNTSIIKSYATLQEAINAVGASYSATIVIDEDFTLSSPTGISNQSIKIKLNNKNVSFSNISIYNAHVTIEGNVITTTTVSSGLSVDNGSTVTIDGNLFSSSINDYYAMKVDANSKVTINGNLTAAGLVVSNHSSEVVVNGNVTSNSGYSGWGRVHVSDGGRIEISGDLRAVGNGNAIETSSHIDNYIKVGNVYSDGQGIWCTAGTVFVDGILSFNGTIIGVGGTGVLIEPYPEATYTVGNRIYYDYTDGSAAHVYILKEILGIAPVKDKYTELAYDFSFMADAPSYQVQRSLKSNKGFATIGTTTDKYFYDYYLKAGTTYYYRVRTVKIVNKKNVYSKWSKATKLVTDKLPIPTIGSGSSDDVKLTADVKSLKINWANKNKMVAIQIYYATTNTKTTKWKIVTVSASDFTLKMLDANKKYFCKVRYVYFNGSTSYSDFSKVEAIITN